MEAEQHSHTPFSPSFPLYTRRSGSFHLISLISDVIVLIIGKWFTIRWTDKEKVLFIIWSIFIVSKFLYSLWHQVFAWKITLKAPSRLFCFIALLKKRIYRRSYLVIFFLISIALFTLKPCRARQASALYKTGGSSL